MYKELCEKESSGACEGEVREKQANEHLRPEEKNMGVSLKCDMIHGKEWICEDTRCLKEPVKSMENWSGVTSHPVDVWRRLLRLEGTVENSTIITV